VPAAEHTHGVPLKYRIAYKTVSLCGGGDVCLIPGGVIR
jgi:hypothetical protein